jgi:hypothetical protein
MEFECGFDLRLQVRWFGEITGPWNEHYRQWEERHVYAKEEKTFAIELKPQMGDDFPAVPRQMKRNGADTLVIGSFEATNCTLAQVRTMFGEKRIITLQEIKTAQQRQAWPPARLLLRCSSNTSEKA